ncbi:sulfotransferase 1 family member D1-like [Leptodactylus fuscus]|uniref:sulfotransferase 1 family member D1-like n=1 Tax=Leptodactylus fuscus TaxID=238119 RepID=UPI003F4F3429
MIQLFLFLLGNTWTSEIVDLIYCDGDEVKARRDAIYNRVPFLELCVPGMPSGIDQLNAAAFPRLVKTHLPIHLMPASFWEKDVKVIYVARNAKDVAVSYYYLHKMSSAMPDPGPWDVFLDNYVKANVCYSSWYDNVKGWWEKRHDHKILYIFYEDMKENPKKEIKKILQFLGKEMSEAIVDKIVYLTSFEVMKDNDMANYKTIPTEFMNQTISPFMRKGIVGDWKNHFTVAQNEQFDEDYKRKMADTDLHFRTEI